MKPRETFAAGMKVNKPRDQEKVVAAFPTRDDRAGRFMDSFVVMYAYDASHKRRVFEGGGIMPLVSSIVSTARNDIVRVFLDEHEADWLWFVDTDMTFDPDIVDRLVEAAHPRDRPIMGALCFSLQDGYRACPTIYVIRNDDKVGRVFDYPKNKLMRVMTGTGCLLIHRSALEKMRDAKRPDGTPRFPKPFEWFHNTQLGDLPVGEDITFCIRAEAIGIPVHVDTSIKCGHEKRFVVDEEMFIAQRAAGVSDRPDLNFPTFVVIAAKNRHEMTRNLVAQLLEKYHHQNDQTPVVLLYDNGSSPPYDEAIPAAGMGLHEMWNAGLDAAEQRAKELGADKWNVAILNNDLEVPPGFLSKLESGIRGHDDNWISYPNHHGVDIPAGQAAVLENSSMAGQTMSGWAFMIRGESGLRFDEQFEFWYGDTDIQKQVEAAGKNVVCVGGCYAKHLEPMKSTMSSPVRLSQAQADEERFAEKWGLDPATLYFGRKVSA
jgi:hypothetical protein